MEENETREALLQRIRTLEQDAEKRNRELAQLRENAQLSALHRKIYEKAAVGICVCHNIADWPHVRFTHWNTRMTAITGYTMAEINRLGWYQSLYPAAEIQQKAIERMRRMRAGNDIHAEEWTITTKSGEKKHLSISTSVVKKEGTAVHVLALMQDITDRKNAEIALTQERNLFVSGPTMVFKWRAQKSWPVEYASLNVAAILGYPVDALAAGHSSSYADLVHRQDLGRVNREIEKHTHAGSPRFELSPCRLRKKDGSCIWVRTFMTVVRDNAGTITHFLGYVTDISRQYENEQRMGMALEGTKAGLWDWNVQTGETVFNRRWAEIIGHRLEDLEPVSIQTWQDHCHPDDLDRSNTALQKHFSGETDDYLCECRMKHKDGSWVWVLDRGKVMEWDDDGTPVRMTGTHVDITESKRYASLLQAERDMAIAWSGATSFRDRLTRCLETAIRVSSMDCGGAYLVNEADGNLSLAVHHGLSSDFVAQASFYPADSNNAQLVLKGESVYTFHPDLVSHNADPTPGAKLKALAIVPIPFQDRILGCLNVSSHTRNAVPDHCRAALEQIARYSGPFIAQEIEQERIRKRRQELDDLINTLEDMLFILDKDGYIVEINSVVGKVLGYTRDALIGKHVLFVHPEDRHQEARNVLAAMMASQTDISLIPLITRRGSCIPVETRVKFGHWNGQAVVIGISRDISERIKSERTLLQIEKAESLSRMAGAVAHQFNNLLAVVIGNVELLKDDLALTATDSGCLAEVEQAARRAADISKLMLTFLGVGQSNRTPIDLTGTCEVCIAELDSDLPENVTLETAFPERDLIITADAGQFRQILSNLMANAWESLGKSEGVVRIDVSRANCDQTSCDCRFPVNWQARANEYACLAVADTGKGMQEKTLSRIFDPYYTEKSIGRGLGLSVVLGLVRTMDGCITVESKPDGGSVFRVFFPFSFETVDLTESDKHGGSEAVSATGSILVVDDQDSVRKMVCLMLKKLGFSVLTAENGAEAVALFRANPDEICLVISDLTMPQLNGWETLAALRKIRPGLPVILSSGYDETNILRQDHAEQPQVFLQKPYSKMQMKNAIDLALRNPNRTVD